MTRFQALEFECKQYDSAGQVSSSDEEVRATNFSTFAYENESKSKGDSDSVGPGQRLQGLGRSTLGSVLLLVLNMRKCQGRLKIWYVSQNSISGAS